MSDGTDPAGVDASAPALLFPFAAAEVPPELTDALRAHGFQPATENRLDRLADWARRHRQGVLLLHGTALDESAWSQLPASLGVLHEAGWHVLGLVADTDPGGALGSRLLGAGSDDACVAAPPWTLLLHRLAAHHAVSTVRFEHERLQRAVELAPCGLTITDAIAPDNPIIYANDGFQRITGYTPAEILGRNCRFLQRGRSEQPAVAELRAAVAAGRDCHVTLVNFRKDGRAFHNELAVTPLRDPSGRVTAFVGIQNDVTARVEAEQATRESEERFRTLADLLPTRVWLTDDVGRFEFLNEAWRDFLPGEDAARGDSRGWLRWVHPEDRAAVDEALGRARETKRPLGFEARLLRPGGEERWFTVEGVPRLGPDGVWRGLLGSALDVTDDRAAQDLMGRRLRQLSLQTMILRQLVGDDRAAGGAAKVLEMLGEMSGASALHLLDLSPGGAAGRLDEAARWEDQAGPPASSPFSGRRLSEVLPFSAGPLLDGAEPVVARANELRRLVTSAPLHGLLLAPIRRGGSTAGALAAASVRGGEEWERVGAELLRGIGPALPSLLAAARGG